MSWVQQELGSTIRRQTAGQTFDFSDRKFIQCTASIPKACEGWAETKAAYRLLSNEALDAMEILTCDAGKSEHRAQGQPLVLCLQDTTELDFSNQPGIAGLERLSYVARHVGPF